MFNAQIPKNLKPPGSELASRFGMAHVPHGQGGLIHDGFGGERGDDFCSVICHIPTMPNDLAFVKPNDARLWQNSCHVIVRDMELSEKPFGDIADRIRWHRALEALDQKDYAEKIGVKRAALSNWESGDYRLSPDGALALRRTYGLSLDFMFEGIDDALPMTLRMAWRDRPAVNASRKSRV